MKRINIKHVIRWKGSKWEIDLDEKMLINLAEPGLIKRLDKDELKYLKNLIKNKENGKRK